MSSNVHPELRVLAIGGGTGLSTLLRGLKKYVLDPGRSSTGPHGIYPCPIRELSAVVTVTDDGGSSGRLREELNILPPGDIRNCMVALSEDSHLLSKLFQYRFEQGDLQGHSFGNLFVAAMSAITGDFAQAVHMSSQILATRGRIYPATNTHATLVARMDDGSLVHGETNITASKRNIIELMLDPPSCEPLPDTLKAIAAADLITVGPGSLYTSVISNLLVDGIASALRESGAMRFYVCNLMTQANESLGLTASQHIEKIFDHAGGRIFDYVLINTGPIHPGIVERYASEGQEPILPDLDRVRALGVEPVTGSFAHEGEKLRHAYDTVAATLLRIAGRRSAKFPSARVDLRA